MIKTISYNLNFNIYNAIIRQKKTFISSKYPCTDYCH